MKAPKQQPSISPGASKIEASELTVLRELVTRPPEGVIAEIHPKDGMFKGRMRHYTSVGNSALRCIRLALVAAGSVEVTRILDLPCGYGRILRVLRAAFPRARIVASDIIEEAVEFCATRFDAIPVVSCPYPKDIEFDDSFDLIWCGSLLTHLEEERYRGFLSLFANALAPGGVVVFTVHGAWDAHRLREGLTKVSISPGKVQALLAKYADQGFAYVDYPHRDGYGISISSPSWVCSALASFPMLRLLLYAERGWDNHQDVVACVRTDSV